MFVMNSWYAIGWDYEIKRDLLARTICNKPLVAYRTLSGVPVVLEDACWHRLAPLSTGKLDGDTVTCGYHGIKYSSAGKCVHMPAQEKINDKACVRSYPTIEKHRFIWVWLGEPSLADPDKVPDLSWNDAEGWVSSEGQTIRLHANYQLATDNLLDLTHEEFVHEDSIGQSELSESPVTTSQDGNTVLVERWMLSVDPPPFWQAQYGKPGKVDRWQQIHFTAPCTVRIDVGVAEAGTGAPEGNRSKGVNGQVINTITPETETSSHYFWAFARNYRLEDHALTNNIAAGIRRVFGQDEAMLESQQQRITQLKDRPLVAINIDAGSVRARKIVQTMESTEQ